jgi:S1-C subfamily serine protease
MTEDNREESQTGTSPEQPTETTAPDATQPEPKPEPVPAQETKVEQQPHRRGSNNAQLGGVVILLVLSVGFSGYIYFDSSRRIGDLINQVSSLTSSVQGLSTSLSSSNSQITQLSQAVNSLSQGGGGSTNGGTSDVSALYNGMKDSVVLIKSTIPLGTATGSGFVYDTEGRIVTNNHVIDGANSITVTFINGTIVPASVVGADPYSDIAVIQVSAPAALLKPLRLGDSSALKVGQEVLAIGNPYGLADTLTTGIISATGREMDSANGYPIVDVIQTDAAINPGNSGGPLLNLNGEVVGINTAIPSQTSSGIGFAVPSNTIAREIESLISTGKYDQVYIGIQGTDVTPGIIIAMNLPAGIHGTLLTTVSGPAAAAGLRGGTSYQIVDGVYTTIGGDVITKADGQVMKGLYDLILYMQRNKRPGDEVALTIIRGSTQMFVTVTLGVRTG